MSQNKNKAIQHVKAFDEIVSEIRTGPFSILSEKAQDRLVSLMRWAMTDGYDRGYGEAERVRGVIARAGGKE